MLQPFEDKIAVFTSLKIKKAEESEQININKQNKLTFKWQITINKAFEKKIHK